MLLLRCSLCVFIFLGAVGPGFADPNFKNIYWHDEAILNQAEAARKSFDSADRQLNDVWQNMLDNVKSGYEGGCKRIKAAGDVRFETYLTEVGELKWEAIWECGDKGRCNDDFGLDSFGSAGLKKQITGDNLSNAKKSLSRGSTDQRLKNQLKIITRIGDEIEKTTLLIQTDPDGIKELKDLPAGNAAPTPLSNLLKEMKEKINQLDARTADSRRKILETLQKVEAFIQKTQETINSVTLQDHGVVKITNEILDVLRKKEVLDSLKNGPLKMAVAEGREAVLPESFRKALKSEVKNDNGQPLDIMTVGDLLDFLSQDHSGIEEIRLSLLQKMRSNIVALRANRLSELKAKLTVHKKIADLFSSRLSVEQSLKAAHNRVPKYFNGDIDEKTVVGTLEILHRKYQDKLSAGEKESYMDIRDQFSDIVMVLALYSERVGYLLDSGAFLELESAAVDHRYSILNSQLAADGRATLIKNGLDAMVSAAEGGVTAKDFAKVIDLLHTGLLTVIAATN